ncbi:MULTISPECIES: hypothetical protein [Ralstonia solanacearum species complex]|uniref:Uncharacterized protein n=3 Tax=Ralstonia solanacearum species complex TaxID=3116862 RepID=A0A223H987_9RALS|nr:hypothetical protein [Ralstonia pseudosolanacearum]AUS45296.1 hypothetical protein CYD94_24940 [Ralstonia solanacearum]ASL76459.1 hypothetical protein BC350_23330 [Ralstonia pseudosolanacearum]AST29971.1 hypothetical protein CDC45_22580 [Ralstonia pseudosolanacearum]AST88272.1 hypothetical protein CIG66_17450 [Ralstonia pseudosolanacearum]AXV75104.1 hypothetical protein CJO75_21620 [Ralstonia solanacearum]
MKPAARLSAVPLRLHRAWAERGVLFLPLVLLLAPVRNGVESTMALQMLVEFPLVMASGWVASRIVARRLGDGRVVEAVMRMGLAPLVGATLCLMFWMVPLALDLARLDAGINAAKLGSLFVAGGALEHGLRRAPGGGLVFFAGNMVWMLATVGLLFHDTPSRLCANYLLDDQRLTGVGLLGYAVAVAAGLVLHLRRLPGFGFTFLAQERDRDGQ